MLKITMSLGGIKFMSDPLEVELATAIVADYRTKGLDCGTTKLGTFFDDPTESKTHTIMLIMGSKFTLTSQAMSFSDCCKFAFMTGGDWTLVIAPINNNLIPKDRIH